MFKSRFVRLGVMALGVLGLLGVGTPPAHATTVATITFTGAATLTGGTLGYPCANPNPAPLVTTTTTTLPGGEPNVTVDFNHHGNCPQGTPNVTATAGPHGTTTTTTPLGTPLTSVTTLTLSDGGPDDAVPNASAKVHGGGTMIPFVFFSTTCLEAVWNSPGKASTLTTLTTTKEPLIVDDGCAIGAGGTVSGWCGLSQGQGTGAVTDSTGNIVTFTFHFTGIASQLLIIGHAAKANGQTGKLVGTVNATPNAITGDSCTNKSANDFIITGAAATVLT